uniref:Uncharacterized protein n=1 Tax=Setaria viridis TaxID=4556 RepID=A0A4U6TQE8_SETVI|nr:hypothetical protein SEVIR_7G051900v2 [Setaria viridis]
MHFIQYLIRYGEETKICLSENHYFYLCYCQWLLYAHTELFKAICILQSTHPHLAIIFLYEVMTYSLQKCISLQSKAVAALNNTLLYFPEKKHFSGQKLSVILDHWWLKLFLDFIESRSCTKRNCVKRCLVIG